MGASAKPIEPGYPGLLAVFSGPSGVGKTTIAHSVEGNLGGVFSVSMTTRPRADGEVEGRDYWFVDHQRFDAEVQAGNLLEWAEVHGNRYGTPRQPVVDALADGRLMLLEIDVAGAVQVRQAAPEALAVFIEPPSEAELLNRLRSRKRDDEATIQRRFQAAKREIAAARASGVYDHFIVNDELEDAIDRATVIVGEAMARAAGPGRR